MKFVNIETEETQESTQQTINYSRSDYINIDQPYDDLYLMDTVATDSFDNEPKKIELINPINVQGLDKCYQSQQYFTIDNLFSELQTSVQKEQARKNLGIDLNTISVKGDIKLGIINLSQLGNVKQAQSELTETNQIAYFIITDNSGKLPSKQTAYSVPTNVIRQLQFASPNPTAQELLNIVASKVSFSPIGVNVGDLIALTRIKVKVSDLTNVIGITIPGTSEIELYQYKILATNDAKPYNYNGITQGVMGLMSPWDKTEVNKIRGIENVANAALPRIDYLPSKWENNMNNCLETGVYPWCTLGRPAGSTGAYTCISIKSSTNDGNYYTIEQTAYGRQNELGQIYKRIIFYKKDGTDTQYHDWINISDSFKTNYYTKDESVELFAKKTSVEANNEKISKILSGETPVKKADKLTNRRTISLSGYAVSNTPYFDGSSNVTISVNSINDRGLQLGQSPKEGNYYRAKMTPIDTANLEFSTNRLAFNNPECITIEYSNDGGNTWLDYEATDIQKIGFISGMEIPFFLGKNITAQTANQDMLRIKINHNRGAYTNMQRLYIYLSTQGAMVDNSHSLLCKVEKSLCKDPENLSLVGNYLVSGWSGWNSINIDGYFGSVSDNNIHTIQLTFSFNNQSSAYISKTKAKIMKLQMLGNTVFTNSTGCKLLQTGHIYAYDSYKNVIFPAKLTSTILESNIETGTAPIKVKSTTKVSNLKSEYSEKDVNGNIIHTTYATKLEVENETYRAENIESTLSERIKTIEDDVLLEIGNRLANAVQKEDIVNNLTDGGANKALSAEMGKELAKEASTEHKGLMSAEDKSRLATSNSYVIKEADTLQDAINALDNIIPNEGKCSGVRVTYTDNNNVVHTYTFMSDTGFTNPTRWKSDVVNPYIESEQPVGLAYRLSDIIDYIKVTATGDIDDGSVYSFGICGYFTSTAKYTLQVLKDGVSLGYIYLDAETLTGTLAAGNFIIEVKVNTLYFTPNGTTYNYSQYYNRITPQLFINAKLDWEIGTQATDIAVLENKHTSNVNEVKHIEETIFEMSKELVSVTYKYGYYRGDNGVYVESTSRCCTDRTAVVPGEKYFVTVDIGGSTQIAYLAQWSGDAWVGIADDFKANSGNAVEREYAVPEGVTHIAVCSYNTTPPTLEKLAVSGNTSFYRKNEVFTKEETRQLVGGDSAVKIYGVRNNLSDPSLTTWERTSDAVGMVASVQKYNVTAGKDDFLDVYPFNAIRECNIETLENGATKITYKDENGFSLTEKDVFVEFPLWYERRYIKDGYEYREICAQQSGGFYPSPMFIEDGRVLDKVYIAKYETSLIDGSVCSRSGKEPLTYKTVAEFREFYESKGKGYAGMDIRTVMSLQHLYLVRFAEKNTQNYIGGGFTDLYQPWGFGSKDYSGSVGGEVITKNFVKSYPSASLVTNIQKTYWIGKQIGFVKSNETALYDRATITDLVVSEDGRQITIYFDKEVEIITEAADASADSSATPIRTWFGGCGQNTGATDNILHDTGSTELAVSANKGSCAVKIFGLENMWGNIWHELDGLLFKGDYVFIGFAQKDYNNNADGYIPIAHGMLEQKDLGSVGAQFCFIGNMWIDNAYPWVAYPESVRGGTPSDKTKYTDGINENSSYGDAYYFDSSANNGVNIEVHGGGFDHYERAGLFCHRCWNSIDFKWYLQGSRMQFKMIL